MKIIFQLLCVAVLSAQANAQNLTGSEEDRRSLEKTTLAIREAFDKGDAALAVRFHHPDVIKYFGKDLVIKGRNALQQSLTDWFKSAKVEFIEYTLESTIFTGETAIETCIFEIKVTPKDGSKTSINRSRAMVVYIRDKNSPTGWSSLREVTQEAPDKKE